ncbi:ankyrin repeat and SOCS box protein 15b isoform X1 [Betta splendens]|uniref:Ankyrin repeat and SOCS box protein 15b isoform X1 n=1 Tax=Betta splendens TaxID=158456 RepID=A0A9W2Y230_BETSP|nr:ankyrin repeat and SOCS box protein 15b isoform X1 [Betta splendens]
MDAAEQEGIDEELVEFVLRESLEDAYKPPSRQPDRKASNSDDVMKIIAAIHEGDVAALRDLSSRASAFRDADGRGRLPLHAAAAQPRRDVLHAVLQALAAADASLEEPTEDGDTALTLAADAGLPEHVRALLQHGASPHSTNGRNESPLLLAVRQRSCDMVLALIRGGAFVEQVCLTKWTAIHEAAKTGCPAVLMLLLRHGAKVTARDGHGVTPLGIAAEHGNTEALDILIQHGGDVNAQASNGDTVLYDASGSGNLDCVRLLLRHGANPNVASYAHQLPVHRAAYEGHALVLRTLVPVTTKRAIRLSGQSPVHSAADGGQVQCLELLIQRGFDVNALLGAHISGTVRSYTKRHLWRSTMGWSACRKLRGPEEVHPVLCRLQRRRDLCREAAGGRGQNGPGPPAVHPGGDTGGEVRAGAAAAVPRGRGELLLPGGVRHGVPHGAAVLPEGPAHAAPAAQQRIPGAHVFPVLPRQRGGDRPRLGRPPSPGLRRLQPTRPGPSKSPSCGKCPAREESWPLREAPSHLFPQFCDFVSVSWLAHVAGGVVRTLLDYVSHVSICPGLRRVLQRAPEWEEISELLSGPRSLQHLCRLLIRRHMSLRVLNDPAVMAAVPFPPRLKSYLTFRELDLSV